MKMLEIGTKAPDFSLPDQMHVKNTGRLQELLHPKAKVTLQRAENPDRATTCDLISVYKPRLKWVNIDSLAPNELMKQHGSEARGFRLTKFTPAR